MKDKKGEEVGVWEGGEGPRSKQVVVYPLTKAREQDKQEAGLS